MPLSDLARRGEEHFHRHVIPRLRRAGWRPRAVAYDGYGSATMVRVIARVVMRPPGAPAEGPLFQHIPEDLPSITQLREAAMASLLDAQRGWRSFIDIPVPFIPFTVKVGGRKLAAQADRGGYIDVVIRNHNLKPGWHESTITGPAMDTIKAPVLIIPDGPQLGVVCDIDDTVMVTHMPRALVASWNAFVKQSFARQAVPGMAALLNRIQKTNPGAPVIYLSTGAWNVVPTLRNFFERNHFPRGPMLMTDWGPTNTGWFRSGLEHKRTQLRRLMIDLPEVKWLLIGDDGQFDRIIYGDLAHDHGDKVAAIAIRKLTSSEHVFAGGNHLALAEPQVRSLKQSGALVVSGRDGFTLARKLPASLVGPQP